MTTGVVGIGSDRPARDLKLSDLLVDDVVFVNDIVNFQFKLTASGLAGARVDDLFRRAKHAVFVMGTRRLVVQPGMTGSLVVHDRPLGTLLVATMFKEFAIGRATAIAASVPNEPIRSLWTS